MSKFISGLKNKNIQLTCSGLSVNNCSHIMCGNIVQKPTEITDSITLTTDEGNMLIIANPQKIINIYLPETPHNGQIYKIINVSPYMVAIRTNNINTYFDGADYNFIILNQYDKLNITYYNHNWFLI